MKKKRDGLDRTDDLVISQLVENSRASYTELARRLNMSESAIRRRVSNLISDKRIIRFTVEVDDQHLSSAITWVSVNPSVPTSQVSEKMKNVKGVEKVYETAGQFDIAAIVKGASIVEVNRTVEGIRRIEGVISTSTTIIMRTVR
jgi:Lrp/AsnC family transcriptional regulator of lysine biosynthesis